MPPAIDAQIREQVIKEWLEGHTRDKIANDNQIGAGTVTDIVTEWKKGIDKAEYESIRELSICCRKEGIDLGALTSSLRLNNYVEKLGANPVDIESLIAFLINSQEPQRLLDITNQIAQFSISELVPLDRMNDYINKRKEEMQRLENEIKTARDIRKE